MEKNKRKFVCQGGIYMIDLSPVVGSEQGGIRPCICVSNTNANLYAKVAHFVPLTTVMKKNQLPTHYRLFRGKYRFLKKDCLALAEQVTCKSIERVESLMGYLDDVDLKGVQKCIYVQFGLLQDYTV